MRSSYWAIGRQAWFTGGCTLIWYLLLAISVRAQAPLTPLSSADLSSRVRLELASHTTRAHLERAAALAAGQQWDEAVETLRTVLETDGEALVGLPPGEGGGGFVRYVTVRQYCQMQLAGFASSAPEALALYRQRVDPLAQRWYEQAVADRDVELLVRIVDQLLVSSYGDQALMRLGELYLERGQYRQARQAWESISPLLRTPLDQHHLLRIFPEGPLWLALKDVALEEHWDELEPLLTEVSSSARPSRLVYPDTDLDLAELRARLVLASVLEGSPLRAQVEFELLKRLHPQAEGTWGGRRQSYVAHLQQLLEESQRWPDEETEADWTTFAGSSMRNPALHRSVPTIQGFPEWRVDLPVLSGDKDLIAAGRSRIAETADGLLSYHPLVRDDLVLLNQPGYVRALRLESGQPAFPGGEIPGAIFKSPATLALPAAEYSGVPRYTMTLQGDKLFARMGSIVTGFARPDEMSTGQQGYIVGLDLRGQGKMLPGFPLYPDGRAWAFEGSPLIDGSRLYIAMRRREQVMAQSHVACFDLQTGQMLWRRMIVAADTPGTEQTLEVTHQLLTMAGDTLYYNTNLGAVAALRADDGQLRWVVNYPRAPFRSEDPDRTDVQFLRSLNPCLVFKDLVIAAPADCDRIFALDASTGHLIWATPPQLAADVVHLLGVGQDHLVASGDYLYWFDIYSGRSVGQFPSPRRRLVGHERPMPRGHGRGLLDQQHVYWPTPEAIYVFRQRTLFSDGFWHPVHVGTIPLAPRGVSGGNLVLAGDHLLIATASELVALGPAGRPVLPVSR